MSGWDGTPLGTALLDRVAADLLRRGYNFESPKFKFQINAVIIRYFLGDEWFSRYCSLNAVPNFLAPQFGDNGDPDWEYSFNILILAEMLLNLQGVPGFAECLRKFKGDQIESVFAELQVGTVIKKAALDFAYVDPSAEEGRTYDLNISFSHGSACGEIKCKSQTTVPTPAKVADAIGKARRQIPSNESGIVFIKLPPTWVQVQHTDMNTPARIVIPEEITASVLGAFEKTTRIKRLVFYIVAKTVDPEFGLGVTTNTSELPNPQNGPKSPWNAATFGPNSEAEWVSIFELNDRWAEYGH
jgi:hypothetical protein